MSNERRPPDFIFYYFPLLRACSPPTLGHREVLKGAAGSGIVQRAAPESEKADGDSNEGEEEGQRKRWEEKET